MTAIRKTRPVGSGIVDIICGGLTIAAYQQMVSAIVMGPEQRRFCKKMGFNVDFTLYPIPESKAIKRFMDKYEGYMTKGGKLKLRKKQ